MPSMVDHPKLRSSTICQLCGEVKETGLLVCWPCFRVHDLRNGNPGVERALDVMEKATEN
jgi:hypothetical protein